MKNPDGTPMEVAGTDDPIEMWIPGKPSLVPLARKFSFLTSASSEKVELNYHSIVVATNNTGMHIIIRPESPDDRYRVFFKYMDFPNETYNDWVGEVPTEEVRADSYKQCLNWCTLSTWRTVQHQELDLVKAKCYVESMFVCLFVIFLLWCVSLHYDQAVTHSWMQFRVF